MLNPFLPWSEKKKGFPGGSDSNNAYNARNPGSVPGLGRSPGEGNGNPFQHSCLENSMGRGAWWAAVYGVTKSWPDLKLLIQIGTSNPETQMSEKQNDLICKMIAVLKCAWCQGKPDIKHPWKSCSWVDSGPPAGWRSCGWVSRLLRPGARMWARMGVDAVGCIRLW